MHSSIKFICLTLSISMAVSLQGMFSPSPTLSRYAAVPMQSFPYQKQHPAAWYKTPLLAGPSLDTYVKNAQSKSSQATVVTSLRIYETAYWRAAHKKMVGNPRNPEDNKLPLQDCAAINEVRNNLTRAKQSAIESLALHNQALAQLNSAKTAAERALLCAARCSIIDSQMRRAEQQTNQFSRSTTVRERVLGPIVIAQKTDAVLTKAYQEHLWAVDKTVD